MTPKLHWTFDFYPRPPRGGRPCRTTTALVTCGISIHALREEGDAVQAKNSGTYTISIHALREEGDYASRSLSLSVILFLSTPSARRATRCHLQSGYRRHHFYPRPPRGGRPGMTPKLHWTFDFYPRPPRGGRPCRTTTALVTCGISIHALREEGDAVQAKNSGTYTISIHALREEGDRASTARRLSFMQFLSTPSARRATETCEAEGKYH